MAEKRCLLWSKQGPSPHLLTFTFGGTPLPPPLRGDVFYGWSLMVDLYFFVKQEHKKVSMQIYRVCVRKFNSRVPLYTESTYVRTSNGCHKKVGCQYFAAATYYGKSNFYGCLVPDGLYVLYSFHCKLSKVNFQLLFHTVNLYLSRRHNKKFFCCHGLTRKSNFCLHHARLFSVNNDSPISRTKKVKLLWGGRTSEW